MGIGKLLILTGMVLIGFGLFFLLAGKIPWLGRLPGDIAIKKGNFSFYFPIATSIILSIILSFILWILNRH